MSFGQFIALIIVMATSDDFMSSIKNICKLNRYNVEGGKGDDEEDVTVEVSEEEDDENIIQHSEKDVTPRLTSMRVLIPSVLELIETLFLLFASLVGILQREEVI